MIPRQVLDDDPQETRRRTGLAPLQSEFFGIAAYAATGGFQPFGLPRCAIAWLCRAEALLPGFIRRFAGLRALFVFERTRP